MHDNWKTYKLGDLVEHQKGYAFKSKWYQNTGRIIVRISDTTDNSINLDGCHKIDSKLAVEYERVSLKNGDVVIATVGSWLPNFSSVVGKVIKVPKKAEGALLNQNAVRLRAIDINVIEQKYLYYLLKNRAFLYYIAFTATGSANQASITLKDIFKYEFKLPPLPEQKAIASILSAIDNKIENNLAMNKTLQELAMALYKHWFVDFGPFKDGKFVASELGKIPEGWEVKKLEDIAKNKTDTRNVSVIKKEEPYIALEHIDKATIGIKNHGIGKDATSNKSGFATFDILFGKLRPYFKKVAVPHMKGICSTDILVIQPMKPFLFGNVLCTLFSDEFIDFSTAISTGTRMPRASWSSIRKYKIALPKEQIMIKDYNNFVFLNIEQIHANSIENHALTQLRDTLLPKLISREVSLKEFEEEITSAL